MPPCHKKEGQIILPPDRGKHFTMNQTIEHGSVEKGGCTFDHSKEPRPLEQPMKPGEVRLLQDAEGRGTDLSVVRNQDGSFETHQFRSDGDLSRILRKG